MKALFLLRSFVFTFIFFLIGGFAGAQVLADQQRSNCSGVSESLYDVLNANKVLVVAADGFDCSICMSHAPTIGNLANSNPDKIRVWGAMNYKYSSNAPTCNAVNSWVNSYNWSAVFSFIDAPISWASSGYPTYTVIDPRTKTVAYKGGNSNQAVSIANGIASQITAAKENLEKKSKVRAIVSNGILSIYDLENFQPKKAMLTNLSGQIFFQKDDLIPNDGAGFSVPISKALPNGMYLLKIENEHQSSTLKMLVQN